MSSNTASDEAAAFICDSDELSNDELISIVYDAQLNCTEGVQADVFTYGGHTLILAYAAVPLRDRFSASMRYKRNAGPR